MKTILEKISNLERRLDIEIPTEKVTETLNRIYKGLQQQASIKGFRKGKAPIEKIKSMYADRVKNDVVQELVETYYVKALQEHSLLPLGNPKIEFDHLHETEPFKFSAQFEIKPEINLKEWEGLTVEKEQLNIEDSKVEESLDRMRRSKAQETPLVIIRPAQASDLATIDFEGFMDGQPLANAAAAEQTIELGQSGFIPGFDDGIMGMNVGETRDINLQFPENYRDGLAGKPVTFKITLKRLGQKTLPELNDEFAASAGPFKTLEELKKAIQDDYKKGEEVRIIKDTKSRLMKTLVEKNPIDVPQGLLKDQKQALIKDLHQKMEQQGMPHQEFEEYVKKWDKDFDESAKFIIRSSFLISELADKHNLRPTDDELDEKLEEYAVQTGIEISRIRNFYAEPERKSSLRFQMTEDKVVDFLMSKANVKEVPRSQLKDVEENS